MTLQLRPLQIETFKKLIVNHRFLDKSHAGSGKTPTQCALTGFLMRKKPSELLPLTLNILKTTQIPSNFHNQKYSAATVTNGQFNCRVIWIQPMSLLNKNQKELLAWNVDLKPEQVQIVKGTHLQRQKISLDENCLVWLMTAEAYAKYIVDMRSKFPDILQVIIMRMQ